MTTDEALEWADGQDSPEAKRHPSLVVKAEALRVLAAEVRRLRQRHAEAVEVFATIERELDASEPRPPGGQTTGPRASDWQMTPSTRKALRRLASEAKARLT